MLIVDTATHLQRPDSLVYGQHSAFAFSADGISLAHQPSLHGPCADRKRFTQRRTLRIHFPSVMPIKEKMIDANTAMAIP